MDSLKDAHVVEEAWAREFSEGLRGSRDDVSAALKSFFEKANSLDPVAAAAALGKAGRRAVSEVGVIIFSLARKVPSGVGDVGSWGLSDAGLLTWAAALTGACIAADALRGLDVNPGDASVDASTLGRHLTLLLFISSNEGKVDAAAARTMAAAMKASGMTLELLEMWVSGSDSVGTELHGPLSEVGEAILAAWSKSELEHGLLPSGVRKRSSL